MKGLTITSKPAAEYDLTLESERWDLLALKELQSEQCYCGAEKKSMQTFCAAEYFALPPKKRAALYNRIGEGYKESYQDARAFLWRRSEKKGKTA